MSELLVAYHLRRYQQELNMARDATCDISHLAHAHLAMLHQQAIGLSLIANAPNLVWRAGISSTN